jgi:hypothetical protein
MNERMKARLCLLTLFAGLVLLLAWPAAGQILYENGPINGETDGWTINEGFVVSDSFTISTGNSTITGLSFGAWLFPGDVLQSVDVLISSEVFGGTVFFNQQVNFTQSGCFVNNYGFDVCTETGNFSGPTLSNGTYWLNLLNGVVNDGDPVYWDENSGVGCHSPGCPSLAAPGGEGTLPSEAFSILGTSSGTGSVPEPASLALIGGGFLAIIETLRRRYFL